MRVADTKYGGDEFPEPDSTAFRQVLVDIPQVTGLSFEAAKQALEEAGFQPEDGGQQDSSQPAGTVSGTDPSGQAGRGSTIRIFTSNGQGTTVPDLTGMTQQQAIAALNQAGLKIQGSGQGNQIVTAQNPAPNTPVRRDTAVTVTFGGGGQGGGQGGGDQNGNG